MERPKRPRPIRSTKRREGRVGDESPVEMARVARGIEVRRDESRSGVGEEMEERDGGGDGERGSQYRLSAMAGAACDCSVRRMEDKSTSWRMSSD